MSLQTSYSHEVPLIPQTTRYNCWAAATAMLANSSIPAVTIRTPRDLIGPNGDLQNFSNRTDWITGVRKFAQAHRIQVASPMSWNERALHKQLSYGPIMFEMLYEESRLGTAKGSEGHMVVVYGIEPGKNGSTIYFNDPDPTGKGALRFISYRQWAAQMPALTYRVFWN